jgi:hypothetical protein
LVKEEVEKDQHGAHAEHKEDNEERRDLNRELLLLAASAAVLGFDLPGSAPAATPSTPLLPLTTSLPSEIQSSSFSVLRIRIRIRERIHMFLGLLDPDPDPAVRVMDPAPAPDLDPSITKQKKFYKNLIPTGL